MKPVPYASVLRRDHWPEPVVGEGAGYAGFVALCVWLLASIALGQCGRMGVLLAAVGAGGLPAGVIAMLIARSIRSAMSGGAACFALAATAIGLCLFCAVGPIAFVIAAAGWAGVMVWFSIGVVAIAPFARENPRKRRARRWPHYAQHARRPR